MKKTLITMSLFSILLLTGCATNTKTLTTDLANQIDMLNNTISSVSEVNPSIPPVEELTQDLDETYYADNYQNNKQKLNYHENLKTGIKGKTALIKKHIANELQLSKPSIIAISDLSKNLKTQTKKLNETKSDYIKSVKEIKKSISNKKSTNAQISAKVNTFSTCIDTRSCYYVNILTILSQIQDILGIEDNSFENINKFPEGQQNNPNLDDDLKELWYRNLLNEKTENNNQIIDEEKNINISNDVKNENIDNNTPVPVKNSKRNTDSYRPLYSNIDTYRPYGLNGYGANGYGNYGNYVGGYANYGRMNNYGGTAYQKAANGNLPINLEALNKEDFLSKEQKDVGKKSYMNNELDINKNIKNLIK